MSLERRCSLCNQVLNAKPFWDNLRLHKDCLNTVLEKVRVEAGEVKIKESTNVKS